MASEFVVGTWRCAPTVFFLFILFSLENESLAKEPAISSFVPRESVVSFCEFRSGYLVTLLLSIVEKRAVSLFVLTKWSYIWNLTDDRAAFLPVLFELDIDLWWEPGPPLRLVEELTLSYYCQLIFPLEEAPNFDNESYIDIVSSILLEASLWASTSSTMLIFICTVYLSL